MIADTIQIWVGERDAPDHAVTIRSTAQFTVPDVPAGDLVYGCRVISRGASVFTGWRRTRVGAPAEGSAIPVIYTGERSHRADIVFIADVDSYDSASDAAFLTDVRSVLSGAYYGQIDFLANQDKFNFWLADQTGAMDRVVDPADPTVSECVLTAPANWDVDYSWRDTGAILHTDAQRDCAYGGLFSSEPVSLATILHETAHSPFGLPDEYCCDGGYWQQNVVPSLFAEAAGCQADAPSLGRAATDCRTFTDVNGEDWFLSDPAAADLLVDNGPPRAADLRRFDWYFGRCILGGC